MYGGCFLNRYERKYLILECEGFVIIVGIKIYYVYLVGCLFKIYIDYVVLKWFYNVK